MPTLTESDLQVQQTAFIQRCNTDPAFLKQAVAATLADAEASPVFQQELAAAKQNAAYYQSGNTYNRMGKSVAMQLSESLSGIRSRGNPDQPNSLTIVGYDGDWIGLLPEAARILQYFPIGIIVSALVQALFGTKSGLVLIPLLLLL
jgi:hypothetical protein